MTAETTKISTGRLIFNILFMILFAPALILALGGNWLWPEGWIFGLWFDAMILINWLYLYTKDPALLAERQRVTGAENQKAWDRVLIVIILLVAMSWLIILPLDAERFHWSPVFPLWLKILGGVLLIPSLYLIERTTIENTYLSTMVRIQDERKQHVITTGVYGFVRHPLYFGCLLMMIGTPLLIGSIYGLVLSLIGTIAVMVRIVGEEAMLTNELEGYEDYKKKVTRRLIPFVW